MPCTSWEPSWIGFTARASFPKSLDVSKAIDKAAGIEREVEGKRSTNRNRPATERWAKSAVIKDSTPFGEQVGNLAPITAPATPEAEQWQGWGTAMAPSHEPVVVARKPLIGTVVENCLRHGTGAINVDATRIRTDDSWNATGRQSAPSTSLEGGKDGTLNVSVSETHPAGRWPKNTVLVHDSRCRQTGTKKVRSNPPAQYVNQGAEAALYGSGLGHREPGDERPGCGDPDGTETVAAWECVPECMVGRLDEQAGELKSGTAVRKGGISDRGSFGVGGGGGGLRNRGPEPDAGYGDSGSASRFFPQFQATEWECHPDCAVGRLDEQAGERTSGRGQVTKGYDNSPIYGDGDATYLSDDRGYGDSGSCSRFFPQFQAERALYQAKAGRRERDVGLEGFEASDGAAMRPRKKQCRVCGTRAIAPGPSSIREGPTCGHDDWEWVEDRVTAGDAEGRSKGALRNAHPT